MSLPKGTWVVGNKWYGECQACGKIIRINKPIVGSLHLCLSDEDIKREQEKVQGRQR